MSLGAATAENYALLCLADWRIAGFFIASRIAGGFAGVAAGKALAARKTEQLFTGATVIAGGLYASGRGLMQI